MAFMSVRGRREVSQFGACLQARACDAHDDAPPRAVALRVARGVADRVLARQLVGNLPVDAGELRQLVREERPRAGFLRELAEHELRFLEPLRRRAGAVRRTQADRVYRGLRSLRQ